MKSRFFLAAALCATGFVSQSHGMPVARPAVAPAIIDVAGGCGRGWHPTSWGRCVPNYYAPGYGGYGVYGGYYPYRYPRYGYWR